MVAFTEDATSEVWHTHADEHNGAAIGCDNGDENTRTHYDKCLNTSQVETEVCGILIAQQQDVHRFDEQHAER